ncbi:scopoletin glucosyltransferase-like [Neltuma alba]|uniref:scopoletin glucosyltransferase-like n=1 Tax=Neltuma alba TaxID=207710 RepID=UPI0010A53D32|nr:scopoletin glucosyltransferase-like [Prosopis alba]
MNSDNGRRLSLHIFFFPFLAHGHITPMLHLARLFSSRGVKATVITTPLNASLIPHAGDVHIQTIDFPCPQKTVLPQGCENLHSVPSQDLIPAFLKATAMLREPLEQALSQCAPHCIVADMMFPWVTRSAAEFGIPVLVFNGSGFFTLCAVECMSLYRPYEDVSTDWDAFVIPSLPGEIKMTRTEVGHYVMRNEEPETMKFFEASEESNAESYGVLVNSFHELEHDYVEYCRKVLGKKAWHVGPVSLCRRHTDGKRERESEESNAKHECLKWLDTREPSSVVYVCFGSLTSFPKSQLREIAKGLEASGHQFIWAVATSTKSNNNRDEDEEEWLPDEGYEKRIEGKGLIIRGWAPQVQILEHKATGAFMTHCGWNSMLESVCAGVPMITWPNYADQFYNEKLVTSVLKIGVGVGAKNWSRLERERIEWEAIEKAVRRMMEGEEAEEMRKKAKELACKASQAMQEGGSSLSSLDSLIHHLISSSHH